ncbi:MAG: DnaJ domain-containing protein [Eubacteriales bacterium]|nr:DnaJ domain-containing protein [Eubacteriales bacterium]MDD3350392.1 DnaJ domain-containing protein [Eubacteriales bacterium]
MGIQIDYYRVLQVHEDADQEIISAAYKCLSKLYHPDINKTKSAAQRMTDINVAYAVIGDERRRKEYHREWLRQKKGKTESIANLQKNRENKKLETAASYLDAYFRDMVNADWSDAYQRLTGVDQENIPAEDFIKWKNAVSQVYKLGNYQLHYLYRYESCEYGGRVYPEILQFAVTLTEYNRMTEQMNQEQTEKYIALEPGGWKICLGYTDLKPSIMRFICLAETLPKVNKDEICRRAIISIDPLTGLLSRNGFLDEAEKEIRRSRRYGNPLTVAVMTVRPSKELLEAFEDNLTDACVSYVSGKLSAKLRKTDIIGRCEDAAFAILLTETDQLAAQFAMQKLMDEFVEDDDLSCNIFWGCTPIEDNDAETAIAKGMAAAMLQESRKDQILIEEEKTDRDVAKLGKYGLYDILRFNRKWKNHF